MSLIQTESKKDQILDTTEDGFFTLDRKWSFSYINRKAANSVGLEAEELIGKVIWDVSPEISGTNLEKVYRQAMELQVAQRIEMKGLLTGSRHNIIAFPSAEGISVYWQDISKQKEAENKLAFQEQMLAQVNDAIIAGDEHQVITYWNKTAEKIPGWAAHEVINDASLDVTFTVDENGKPQGATVVSHDITERRQMEIELKESRDKYQALIETNVDFIWEMDAMGRYTYCSPQMEKLWGIKPAEMIGKTPFDMMPPDVREIALKDFLKDANSPEGIRGLETTVYDGQGNLIFIETSGVPLFADSGILQGYRGVTRDITERKRAEEALKKSEERFRAYVTASSDMIYCMNPDWTEIHQLNGKGILTNTESPDKNWLQKYIHPEDQPQVSAVINKAIRTKSIFELEHRVLQADGSLGWTFSRAVPLLDAEGEIVEWFGAAKDITARKQAEAALQESEKQYRELVKYAPTGIYEVDFRNNRFLSVNDAICQFTGYSREELLEMNPFDILDELSKIVFQKRIKQWLNGEKPDQIVEYKIRAKDGREIYASLDVTFTTDKNGKPLGATVVAHDVTERKHMENALLQATRNAENHQLILEAVIQQMPVGIIITDASGSAARNNAAMDKIWRRKMHYTENIENHGYIAYHPDGRQYELDEWPLTRSLQKEEIVIGEEMVILRGDGTKGCVHVSSTPVKEQNGQIIAGVVIDVDITAVKQTEEELLQYKRKLTEIVENIDGGFITLNSEWQFTDLNTRAAVNVGYKPADLIGKVIWEVFPKVVGTQMETCFRQCMNERIPIHFEECGALTNKWYLYDLYPTQEGIVNFWYDITERKKTEKRLERSNQKINEIIDSIQEDFYVLDRNWNFVYAGKSFTSRIGKEPQDFIGKNIWSIFPWHIGTVYEENVRYVMEKREIRRFEIKGKYTDSYYRMAVFPSPEGITLLGTDITEQKKIDEILKQSEQRALALVKELKKADQNKNRFLNMLSHELRNPLASIMMSLSLLNRISIDGEQALRAREIAVRQGEQLTRLVDDMLDITRIAQNKIIIKKVHTELNRLVQKTLEDYKEYFAEKEVTLEIRISSDPIYLEADPARLTQVIGNLLHNAAKFTVKGDRTLVTVLLDEKKQEAVITIKDNGIGIKPALLSDLFEPFVQVESSLARTHGGLGLGLAIVKGMVELHGGSVTVHSEGLGCGTQFTIRLPVKSLDEKAQEDNRKRITVRSFKILVIDDIPDIAEILSSLLSYLGHEILIAYSGNEGLAKAKEFMPEVVICDIGLPGMNGYEVAKSLRSDKELKDTFLIALSGFAQPEDLERSREAGFNTHLAKPVNLDILEQVLAEKAI